MRRTIIMLSALLLAAVSAGPVPVSTAPPAGDATALIQGLINYVNGSREIVLPCGVWNTNTGFTVPSGGLLLRGEQKDCAVIHLTANVTGILCGNPSANTGISAPFSVLDVTFTGTAPNYTGSPVSISDAGQEAIHVYDCPVTTVRAAAQNIAGTAFDCEFPAFSFAVPSSIKFDISVTNSYRGGWQRNACEYSKWVIKNHNNIFGMIVSAGNIDLDADSTYNYANLQIVGQSNPNPCHGRVRGNFNHGGGYNIDILSCPIGMELTGVIALGDGGGLLNSGGGNIRIANSKGINFVGGELGSIVILLQADPVTGSTASAGPNKIEGMWIRDDISGWVNPSVGYAGGLELKLNFDANSGGQWPLNN